MSLLFSVVCPELSDPVNGTVEQTVYGLKQTATFSCDPGFGLVGTQVLTCQENGTWNNQPPVCRGKYRTKRYILAFSCHNFCEQLNSLYDVCKASGIVARMQLIDNCTKLCIGLLIAPMSKPT